MAKKKPNEQVPTREKASSRLEEINKGVQALQEHIADVEDLTRDGHPYRDAARSRVEHQIRETIRGVFGEQSFEYQHNKDSCLKSTSSADIAQALQILRDLILKLEEQKLGVAGISPSRSPSEPTAKAPGGASRSQASYPSSAASAAPGPSGRSAPTPPPPPAQPARAQAQPPGVPAPTSRTAAMASPGALADTVERVKRVGNRFHFVARQLRLRSEYRATLEVDDQYDAQDLFYALLRYEFDDIGTEEWVPSYAEFMTQTTFFLEQEQIAIVVKKTKQGRGPKELAEELQVDAERYAAHPVCKRLFSFVYDPEGRIGNPRGLEAELARTQGNLHVEALVAPK